MIEMTAPPLPALQSAVDALHARLTAGRTRATGTAVTSGLTGPNATPSPEVFQIIEAVMCGHWGSQMMEIWSREELHVAGASEDDWKLECEAVYQADRLGHSGETLARLVEEAMRSGPYRAKWDERRGAVSWLTQDIANAIATVQKRLEKYQDGPTLVFDDEGVSEPLAADETLEQKVVRLERELSRERSIRAKQQAIIQAQRAELEDKTAFLSHVTSVLAKPNDEMSSTEKVVALALANEVHYRADRGRTKLPLIALVERTGLSKNTVSNVSRALTERAGSPWERRVTREMTHDEDGMERWNTTVEFRPLTENTRDTLRAVVALPAAPDKPKHGGSEQATAERQRVREAGQCSRHDNQMVTVKGFCPHCGEVVGERQMTRQEFVALNHQVGDSDAQTPQPVAVVTSTHNICDSALVQTQMHQLGDSDPLVSLSAYVAIRSQPGDEVSGSRCGQPRRSGGSCRSTMYRDLGGGRLHCLGCAAIHEPLAAVAGGEE